MAINPDAFAVIETPGQPYSGQPCRVILKSGRMYTGYLWICGKGPKKHYSLSATIAPEPDPWATLLVAFSPSAIVHIAAC